MNFAWESGNPDAVGASPPRRFLAELLDPCPDNVLAVGYFDADIERVFNEAVLGLKLEGLVAKRVDSLYVSGVRSADWVKVKRKGAVPPERFKHKGR